MLMATDAFSKQSGGQYGKASRYAWVPAVAQTTADLRIDPLFFERELDPMEFSNVVSRGVEDHLLFICACKIFESISEPQI